MNAAFGEMFILTLPAKNVSLTEWNNSDKEKVNDEDIMWWSSYFGHVNRLLSCRFTLERCLSSPQCGKVLERRQNNPGSCHRLESPKRSNVEFFQGLQLLSFQ